MTMHETDLPDTTTSRAKKAFKAYLSDTSSPSVPTRFRAVELEDGTVCAVAARGHNLSVIDDALRSRVIRATIALPENYMDVVLLLRQDRQTTIRVHGQAHVLATKIGGRTMWVERGVARLPTRSVEHMLVLIGITLDPETRKAVEEWSRGERAEDELRSLVGPQMDTSEVVRVRDHQRPDFTDGNADTEAENALFDFLLQESSLDERATPDMVRRVSTPDRSDEEASGDVPDDLSISTTLQSGPPFCPTLCVRTSQAATPPRPAPADDDEPLLSDEDTMVPSPPGATPRLQETPSSSIESGGMVVVGPPSSPMDLSSSMSGSLHMKRTQEPPRSGFGAGPAAAGGLVVGVAAMSLLVAAAIVGMAFAYTVM